MAHRDEAHPRVLGAFGIMRRGERHLAGRATLQPARQFLDLDGRMIGVGSDLVGGDVAVPAEARRVLMRLGQKRAGDLLEADLQRALLGRLGVDDEAGDTLDRGVRTQVFARLGGDVLHQGALLLGRRLPFGEIGAIARESDEQSDHRLAQRFVADLERVLGADGGARHVDELVHFGRQLLTDHLVLGLEKRVVKAALAPRLAAPAFVEPRQPFGIGEDARNGARRLVAGGALDRPGGGHGFITGQDLLDPDRRVADMVAQALQIGRRIGKPVDMIEPDALHQILFQKLEQQRMHVVEHRLVLDPHADQAGDVEETPVRDTVALVFPMGQPPRLGRMRVTDRLRVAAHLLGRQRALGHRDGEMLGGDLWPVLTLLKPERPRLEHLLEGFAQKRQHQPPLAPVDVEMPGIAAVLAMAQHVAQPRVFQMKGRVVRHDVENDPEAGGLGRLRQSVERDATAQGRVDLGGVGHVVAMG